MLNQSVKISRKMLSYLCSKWVEKRGGFDVGRALVEFSLLDLCLGLGLRVLGEKNDLNDQVVDNECMKFFCPVKVHVKMIYDFFFMSVSSTR